MLQETVRPIPVPRFWDLAFTGLLFAAAAVLLSGAVILARPISQRAGLAVAAAVVLGTGVLRSVSLRRTHLPTRVLDIESDSILVWEGWNGVDRQALRRLGGSRSFTNLRLWSFPARDDHATAAVFTALRDLDIPFVTRGTEWGPGDVFHDLRKRGLVSGPFKEFAWDHLGWVVRAG